jgi:hypothetical protein
MKAIPNNEADGVLERLLKAEMRRASRAGASCFQFDPDFAAAYIERNLTPSESSGYELHISACPNCRIRVAGLARLGYETAAAEGPLDRRAALPVVRIGRESEAGPSRIWSYLLQPQWIAVAAAALIAVIAIPVFIVQKSRTATSRAAAGQIQPGETATNTAPGGPPETTDADSTAGREPGHASQPGSNNESARDSRSGPSGNPTAAAEPAGAAGGLIARYIEQTTPSDGKLAPAPASSAPAPVSKSEAENQQPKFDDASENRAVQSNTPRSDPQQNNPEQKKVQVNVTAAAEDQLKQQTKDQSPASPGEGDKAKAAKADQGVQLSPAEAQTLPKENAVPKTLKPGAISSDVPRGQREKATIRPSDSEPPKTDSPRDESAGRGSIASGPAKEFATVGKSVEVQSVRKQPTPQVLGRGQKLERRVEGKRFRLQAGIWTDKAFKPDKEIAAVTLIRDGDVYKSVLEKQPGLKAFLAGFASDERVIVVYKNITYKVFPPRD